MASEDDIARTLASSGAATLTADEPLFDAIWAPARAAEAAEALASGGRDAMLVRAHSAPVAERASEGFGPIVELPALVRVERGGASRLGESAERLATTAVAIERTREPCCGGPACALEREAVRVWLEAGDARWLVAEGRPFVGEADDGATRFAKALAAALEVPVHGDADDRPAAESAIDAPEIVVPAAKAARFAARTEAGRFVLRDHADAGPRATAGTQRVAAACLAAVAIAFWIPAARALSAGSTGRAVALASVAILFSIASFAAFGIASFAAAYSGSSVALAWFGAGRFVVAPWVTRGGAIDLRPEGRLGAAIPCAEVTSVTVEARDPMFAVVISSDHGPIDVLEVDDEALAHALGGVVARAVEITKHPAAQPSAKQRARAKARA